MHTHNPSCHHSFHPVVVTSREREERERERERERELWEE
jgi:hypothetical protein